MIYTGKIQSQPSTQQTSRFAPHGLKAQKLLAQGNALSVIAVTKAPCKGKSINNEMLLRLQGAIKNANNAES